MAILSWVMADGWGDYYALLRSCTNDQNRFSINRALSHCNQRRELLLISDCGACDGMAPTSQVKLLSGCDLILQMPPLIPKRMRSGPNRGDLRKLFFTKMGIGRAVRLFGVRWVSSPHRRPFDGSAFFGKRNSDLAPSIRT